ELYEVLWRQEDATSMLPSIETAGRMRRSARVRVRFLERDFVLDDSRKELTMGRADENDVVVRGTLISRIHARIEVARDRFLLIDQSTNGTFVINQEGQEAFVRRDSIVLQGKGLI